LFNTQLKPTSIEEYPAANMHQLTDDQNEQQHVCSLEQWNLKGRIGFLQGTTNHHPSEHYNHTSSQQPA